MAYHVPNLVEHRRVLHPIWADQGTCGTNICKISVWRSPPSPCYPSSYRKVWMSGQAIPPRFFSKLEKKKIAIRIMSLQIMQLLWLLPYTFLENSAPMPQISSFMPFLAIIGVQDRITHSWHWKYFFLPLFLYILFVRGKRQHGAMSPLKLSGKFCCCRRFDGPTKQRNAYRGAERNF